MKVELLNAEIIDQLKFLTEDDPAFVPSLMEMLTRDTQESIAKFQAAISEQNFAEIKRVAHKLFGASSNLGALKQQIYLTQIQNAAIEQNMELIIKMLPELEACHQETMAALKEVFA